MESSKEGSRHENRPHPVESKPAVQAG
jgi:hypothetical protein